MPEPAEANATADRYAPYSAASLPAGCEGSAITCGRPVAIARKPSSRHRGVDRVRPRRPQGVHAMRHRIQPRRHRQAHRQRIGEYRVVDHRHRQHPIIGPRRLTRRLRHAPHIRGLRPRIRGRHRHYRQTGWSTQSPSRTGRRPTTHAHHGIHTRCRGRRSRRRAISTGTCCTTSSHQQGNVHRRHHRSRDIAAGLRGDHHHPAAPSLATSAATFAAALPDANNTR